MEALRALAFRYTARLIPFQVACHTTDKDIQASVGPLLARVMSSDHPVTYQVLARVRSNSSYDRMRIIKTICAVVDRVHSVDFKSPQVVIIAEVVLVCTRR